MGFAAFIMFAMNALAQDYSGSWKGVLEVQGMEIPLVFHVNQQEDQYTATMDSPSQGATESRWIRLGLMTGC